MNTLKNKFWALLLITPVAFLSCKKDDQLSPVMNSSTTVNQSNIAEYKWKVNSYKIDHSEETDSFKDYRFKITNDGIASWKNNVIEKGTWLMNNDSVTINIPSLNLNKLNNRWKLIRNSQKVIQLKNSTKELELIRVNIRTTTEATDLPINGLNPEAVKADYSDNTNFTSK